MTLENFFLSSLLLVAGSGYQVTREYALHDLAEGSTFLYHDSEVVPVDNSPAKVADAYYLNVYQEKEVADEAVPLVNFGTHFVFEPTTIIWFQETTAAITYSGQETVTGTLSAKAEIGFDIEGLGKLTTGISPSVSQSLSFGMSYTKTITVKNTEQIYVDGVTNPFGGYAFCYCTVSAAQYYFFYSHSRYTNYDKQEMYQTKLLYENVDGHIVLPNQSNYYFYQKFYFADYKEYYSFVNKWGLNDENS